ncbi:MAG: hypothetical protein LIP09_04345 [Bacteroidales bacterium]|nr:hypothetical protein [Bacteroidales bacterium]
MSLSEELFEKTTINRRLELALRDNKNEIINLRTQIDQQSETLKDMESLKSVTEEQDIMKKEMERLFQSSWSVLNSLCSQYYEKDSPKLRQTFVKHIENEIKKLKNPKAQAELEKSVNRYMGGIIAHLREEYKCVKSKDIPFLTLLIAGLSPKTVCLFQDMSLDNFYVKRYRIVKKIEESDNPDKDWVISLIMNSKS